ncbi:MAG: hypothetical protein Q8N18_15300 [Opitutaceae bacterium]|nr:hypothetical protein [Opitutaceae bacterium]
MNPHDIASNPPAAAPASSGSVSGQASVTHLGADSGAQIRGFDPLSHSPRGAGTPASSGFVSSTLLGDYVGRALGFVSAVLNPGLVENTLGLAKRGGHYAVLAGGAFTLVLAIVEAIRGNSFQMFALGLGLVAAIGVAQFAATRFLDAAGTVIAGTPGRVSSSAFLDCAGLLLVMLAISSLLGGITGAIAEGSAIPLLPAVLSTALFGCLGALALHPAVVNTHPGNGSAGEEGIGLLSFAAKAGLKVAPLVFALFSITGALTLLFGFFSRDGALVVIANSALSLVPLPVRMPVAGPMIGAVLVVVACLVPILAYAGFLLQHLFIDLLRAVLSVPGKLDALRR